MEHFVSPRYDHSKRQKEKIAAVEMDIDTL